jgi:hypothetical protein
MKKIILSIFVLLFALLQTTELKAQSTFTADLELMFRDTARHFVIEVGDSLDLGFSVVNHGPDDIDTSQFVYFSMTGVPAQYFLIIQAETGGLLAIPNGDTIDSRGVRFSNTGLAPEEITETLCFFLRTNDDPDSFIYDPNQNNDTICFELTWKAPDSTTLIRNLAMDATLKISPNPATSVVNVPIDGMQNQQGILKVFSIDGRLMHEERIKDDKQKKLQLNVASWPKGMYIVDLQSEKGIRTGRFVVQ